MTLSGAGTTTPPVCATDTLACPGPLSPLTHQVIKVDALVRLLATSSPDGLAWHHYMRQLLLASDKAVEMTRSDT